MKRHTKTNSFRIIAILFLLFVFVCQFYLYGRILIHPRGIYWAMSENLERTPADSPDEYFQVIQQAWKNLEVTYTPKPDFFINTYGLVQNILGVKIIRDQQQTLVKLNNGYVTLWDLYSEKDQCQLLIEFLKTLQKHGIQVLYVQAPHKICKFDSELPYNLRDFLNPFADSLLTSLTKVGIESMDTREFYRNAPSQHYANFYWSDHHWTQDYAFRTFQEIASFLQKKEICKFEDFVLNRNSYQITEHYFGESEFIRVGKWYVKPDLEQKWELRKDDAVGIEQEISSKEREFGIVRQVFNQGRKGKILVLGDSFSNPIVSFLAPLCEWESHISYRGIKRPILNKILEMKPDCVIVMFWIPTIYELSREKLMEEDTAH